MARSVAAWPPTCSNRCRPARRLRRGRPCPRCRRCRAVGPGAPCARRRRGRRVPAPWGMGLRGGRRCGGQAGRAGLGGRPRRLADRPRRVAPLALQAEIPSQVEDLGRSPLQVLSHLHAVVASGFAQDDDRGRLRSGADRRRPAPSGRTARAGRRRPPDDSAGNASPRPTSAPAIVVAGVAHAEVAVTRPFAWGSGLVARSLTRLVLASRGVDPDGVTCPGGRPLRGRPVGVRRSPQGLRDRGAGRRRAVARPARRHGARRRRRVAQDPRRPRLTQQLRSGSPRVDASAESQEVTGLPPARLREYTRNRAPLGEVALTEGRPRAPPRTEHGNPGHPRGGPPS